ncbi:stalk domain-containing protein [Paenibacillus endoradicis]|uniref:stalk domain-containing protein n=1 Tax=Paenibacillus endoradicis TaxID=2972487 RepID=UPI0021590938|nr:stalk domain-containing protein [Paenibacillus endoradicis]MCR8660123.1 stalk domain-containing protein [Paenibacillus endoradicis]
MKRIKIVILMMVLMCISLPVHAEEATIKVYFDNAKVNFTIDPVLKNGTTFVQFRPIFESLGYKVSWDQKQRRVIAHNNDIEIILTVDSKLASINGVIKQLEYPPTILQGNTLVPIRFVSENSGKDVKWDTKNREIHITSKDQLSNNLCKTITDCISLGDDETLKELLITNRTITDVQFEEAVKSDNYKIVSLLLEHGYELEKIPNSTKSKIFKIAIDNRSFEIIEMLINFGIDPDIVLDGFYQLTALIQAVKNNDYDLVKLLIVKGADPSKQYKGEDFSASSNNWYYTAINLAYELNYLNIYELLMNSARSTEVIPDGVIINDIKDVRSYMRTYYSTLNTDLGIISLLFSVHENTQKMYPYDYKINYSGEVLIDDRLGLGINHIDIEYLLTDVRFTQTQKEVFVKQLREFTEKYAQELIALLPSKKLTGGFYTFTSFVPSWVPSELRGVAGDVFGSSSNQFLTWTNYTNDSSTNYYATNISEFHWYGYFDNGNLTTDIPLRSIFISNELYKLEIGESFAIPYRLLPEEATDAQLVWEVFHPDIASIDSNGVVYGLRDGMTSVKVYSKQDPKIYAFAIVQVGDLMKR